MVSASAWVKSIIIKGAVLLGALFFFNLAPTENVGAQDFPGKVPLLLLPFKVNAAEKREELARSVLGWLKEGLSEQEKIALVTAVSLSTEEPSDQALLEAARAQGAAFLAYGSLTVVGDHFSLDLRLLDGMEGRFLDPLYSTAEGRQQLSQETRQLGRVLGERILARWEELPREKIADYFKERRPRLAQQEERPKTPEAAPEVKGPAFVTGVKVALMPFGVNSDDDSSQLSTKVLEGLTQELGRGTQLSLVGRERALALLKEAAKRDYSEQELRDYARTTEAEYVVYGSVTKVGQKLSLDSKVFHLKADGPFSPSELYVEGSQEALGEKLGELAFQIKRQILKGKIIVTPLEEGAAGAPEKAEAKVTQEARKPNAKEEAKKGPQRPAPAAQAKASPSTAEKKEPRGTGITAPFKKSSAPINITARTLEADNKQGIVTFKGQVVAKRDDMTITSEVLVARYEGKGNEIKQILAQGNVKITQEDRVAVSQKAIFYNDEQKVVLTEGAKILQGKNEITGEVITFYINEDRMVVEGGLGQRVNATIFPASSEK